MARTLLLLAAAIVYWTASALASESATLYAGDCSVSSGSTEQTFACEAAAFGAFLPAEPLTVRIRLAGEPSSRKNALACKESPRGFYDDVVVVVPRGGCGFQHKLVNVANAGARGMIVVNTDDSSLLLGSLEYDLLDDVVAVAVTHTEGERLQSMIQQNASTTVRLGSSLSIWKQASRRIQHLAMINAPMVAYKTFLSVFPVEFSEVDVILDWIRSGSRDTPQTWRVVNVHDVAALTDFFYQSAVVFGDKWEFASDVSFHAAVAAAALAKVYSLSVQDDVIKVASTQLLAAGYYVHAHQLVRARGDAWSRCLAAFTQFLDGDIASGVFGSSACSGQEGRALFNVSGTGLDVAYQNFQRLSAFKLTPGDEECLELTINPEDTVPIELSKRRPSCCRRRLHRDSDVDGRRATDTSTVIHRKKYSFHSAFVEELFHTATIMGVFLDEIGAFTQSKLFYQHAARLCEDWSLSLEFRHALAIPTVFDSTEDMHSFMDQLHININSLLTVRKHHERVLSSTAGVLNYADYYAHPADAMDLRYTITPPTMFVGYQGHDVLPLQRAIFALRAQLFPSLNTHYEQLNTLLPQPEKGPRRRRIAFISTWFRKHSVGKLLLGIIEHLDRSKFHVLIYRSVHFLKHSDEWTKEFHKAADSYVELPVDQDDALALLRHEALDIVVYPELGMDAWTLYLSHHRLAPVQCVFWGHPIPTGNPSIDYFISSEYFISDFFEGRVDVGTNSPSPDSSAWPGEYHGTSFSEQVVLFRGLSTFFTKKFVLPASPFDRATLHLSPTARLYVCPQTLMKLHTDFDLVLQGILSQDPKATIVLLASPAQRVWKEKLSRRFRRILGKDHRRVLFLSTLPYRVFIGLLSTANVVLDPFPFGGGVTTLDALAVGTPVVTLPSAQSVPQLAAGFLRYMDLTETIVTSLDAYITTAIRIAQDSDYRQRLHERILVQHNRIYEDASAVDDWNSFLEEVALSSE